MSGVVATLTRSIVARLRGVADLGIPQQNVSLSSVLALEEGTAQITQADLMFNDERTLAASATENLDLAGVLASVFGATLTFAEIVAIYIESDAGNTNSVVVGGAASNAFLGPFADATDKLNIEPGESVLLTSKRGWPVTAGTGDILKIGNSGGTTGVTYKVVIIGRSVAA